MKLLEIIKSLVKGARFWCVSKSCMFIFPYASMTIEHFLFGSLLSAEPSPDLKNKNFSTTLFSFQFPISLFPLQDPQKSCLYIDSIFFPPSLFFSLHFFFWKISTEKLKKWYNEHSCTLHLDVTIVDILVCTFSLIHILFPLPQIYFLLSRLNNISHHHYHHRLSHYFIWSEMSTVMSFNFRFSYFTPT